MSPVKPVCRPLIYTSYESKMENAGSMLLKTDKDKDKFKENNLTSSDQKKILKEAL